MRSSAALEQQQQVLTPLQDELDSESAVSWPAVWSGSFVTVAFTFVFFLLGSGLGWGPASWQNEALHFSAAAATWLIVTQWLSSGLGGYVTGRLRTKWAGVHTHEVFFRDTAHGLLTWAIATVFYTTLVLFVTSSVSTVPSAPDIFSQPATVSLYTALAMFVGAFISCIASALGGLERDEKRPLL